MTQPTLFHTDAIVAGRSASATISACGRYRYALERTTGITGPNIAWVAMNPSTADATKDDPTIRKVIGFSRQAGYGVALVVNLFAYRAKDVRECRLHVRSGDAEGPDNCAAIMAAASIADAVVCAWGPKPWAYDQADRVLAWLEEHPGGPPALLCVGTAKGGAPLHPLFVPYEAGLRPFNPRRRA